MSARIISNEVESCDCKSEGCPTRARIIEWDCGCVKVIIYNDTAPCSGCSDFSNLRETCEKADDSGTYPDGSSIYDD